MDSDPPRSCVDVGFSARSAPVVEAAANSIARSIDSESATPSSSIRIASGRSSTPRRLVAKPGESRATTGILPSSRTQSRRRVPAHHRVVGYDALGVGEHAPLRTGILGRRLDEQTGAFGQLGHRRDERDPAGHHIERIDERAALSRSEQTVRQTLSRVTQVAGLGHGHGRPERGEGLGDADAMRPPPTTATRSGSPAICWPSSPESGRVLSVCPPFRLRQDFDHGGSPFRTGVRVTLDTPSQ